MVICVVVYGGVYGARILMASVICGWVEDRRSHMGGPSRTQNVR